MNYNSKKIILLGYMGSGKTSTAKTLSNLTQIPAFDLDKIIEKIEQKSISEIFSSKGEIYFRRIEHQIFKDFIDKNDEFILSLGGGTPCYANNHLLIEQPEINSYYLKSSIDTLYNRLTNSKNNRPIIQQYQGEELKDFIAKHLFERSYFYQKANHKITTDNKTTEEVALEILKTI